MSEVKKMAVGSKVVEPRFVRMSVVEYRYLSLRKLPDRGANWLQWCK